MFRLRQLSRSGGRPILRLMWILTAVIVFVGFGFGSNSTISSWLLAHKTGGTELMGQSDEHIAHGLGVTIEDPDKGQSHLLHGLFGTSTREDDGDVSRTVEGVLQGHWSGPQTKETIASSDDCTVEVVSVDFELKEYGGRVHGFGSYSLGAESCPVHTENRTEYVAVTGTYTQPDMELVVRNTMTGEIDLEYHATIQSNEISGVVRLVGTDTVIEDVSLFRQ